MNTVYRTFNSFDDMTDWIIERGFALGLSDAATQAVYSDKSGTTQIGTWEKVNQAGVDKYVVTID